MLLAEGLQAFLRRLKFRESAAFLLHQVIFDPADALGSGEDVFPISNSLAEQDGEAF